jgi:glutamate synthase (NADPH/NADH) small chain
MSGGRIAVDEDRKTSLPDVWAGGDCAAGGRDLTVVAVEDGKRAAVAIDRALRPAVAAAAECTRRNNPWKRNRSGSTSTGLQ